MTKEKEKNISKKFSRRILPPILVAIGIGVTVISSIILWRQDPAASPRTVILRLIDRPYIPGASVGLTLLGIVMMFFFSSKETQKKSVRAGLMVLAAFLVFGGPTYLLYALQQVTIPYPFLALFGLASFVVGLFLFMRLMKGKE
jgi:lipopolysaccharide export LptBFGC system permease protein LptF